MPESVTLAGRMRQAMPDLSPAERRIVRHVLSGLADGSLDTVGTFAHKAKVSAATLLRCLGKLGFASFADFRTVALAEADARRDSALAQMGRAAVDRSVPLSARMRQSMCTAIEQTFARSDDQELPRAIDLLADGGRKLLFAGGRFSQSLAEQLYFHAHLIRPGCEMIRYGAQDRLDQLMDIGRTHVLTVHDFRRYQRDTITLAREAKRRRAKIILVTDPWMSPIADWADVVLIADVRGASPFDSLVSAMALTEALVTGLYEAVGAQAQARLSDFEALTSDFAWDGGA